MLTLKIALIVENLKETIWACRIGADVIHVQEQLKKNSGVFLN